MPPRRSRPSKRRAGAVTVAEYTYDGLGHRIGWHYDTDADSDVDGSDRWYWFAHDDRWRIVATFRGTGASSTDTSPKEQFVFHAGGLNGTGGSSYIDSVILREKDDNSGWTSSADGTLELRRYYLQNWRADVSAIVEADGTQVERLKYSAYGVPIDLPPGDFNADAAITSQDDTDFQAAQGGSYDVRTDLNMDGNSDFGDYLLFLNEYGTGEAGGRGVLSRASNGNRIGYAGYQHAPELLGTKWHVRHRVLESELGRWMRRDPLGYVDGLNLLDAVDDNPARYSDPMGLCLACSPPRILPLPGDQRPPSQFPPSRDWTKDIDIRQKPQPAPSHPGQGPSDQQSTPPIEITYLDGEKACGTICITQWVSCRGDLHFSGICLLEQVAYEAWLGKKQTLCDRLSEDMTPGRCFSRYPDSPCVCCHMKRLDPGVRTYRIRITIKASFTCTVSTDLVVVMDASGEYGSVECPPPPGVFTECFPST